MLACASVTSAQTAPVPVAIDDDGTTILVPGVPFRIWQLRSRNAGQQIMSYVIQTGRAGRLIVIDGGMHYREENGTVFPGDAPELKSFIASHGNHVQMWIVSHQHSDHAGALKTILESTDRPQIDAIYGSFLTDAEIAADTSEPPEFRAFAQEVTAAYQNAAVPYVPFSLGWITYLDGVKLEVLGVKDPGRHPNVMNNSSVVLRVSDGKRSMLFTGDLEDVGGSDLLLTPYKNRLPSDYVQLAHHGSWGVEAVTDGEGSNFYALVGPRNCLWPTTFDIYDYEPGDTPAKTYRAWLTRDVVESPALCGQANSGRHFVPFDSGGVPSEPVYQEIP